MTLQTQSYKGARDFYPEDKRVQNYMFSKMREACERFGFEEYDAPILEPTELYLAKGNKEIIDEQTYTFTDRGGRSVTIRTEMTPTVSRMIAARRQELGYPVRLYSIPNFWRYERMQRGRLREFWQLNADVFGLSGLDAEHEIILLADKIMKSFGAKANMYSIRINSRRLTNMFFSEYLRLNDTQQETLIRLIDRMHKMEPASFEAQAEAILSGSQREDGTLDKLKQYLGAKSLNGLPAGLLEQHPARQLVYLSDLLEKSGVTNARFDPTLMRGFDYYTDVVFEVFDEHPENNRSMFGGGRYDGLIAMFGVEPVPTVGFGMGDVTLELFLRTHGLLPTLYSTVDVVAVVIGNVYEESMKVIDELRRFGINVALDATGRKMEKIIKSAEKRGVQYVMFIGETEIATGQYQLKHLATGEKTVHGLERAVSIVKDYRRRQQKKLKPAVSSEVVEDDDTDF